MAIARKDSARLGHTRSDKWLNELGLKPVDRAERDGATSWDLVLDGRRRRALRLTLILDPDRRAHRVGPFLTADDRQLQEGLPPVPALERRAAVRQVRGI